MKKRYADTLFQKVLVPVIHGCDSSVARSAARACVAQGEIILAGIVYIPESESLSTAAMSVREMRSILHQMAESESSKVCEKVNASHYPWEELVKVIHEEEPDLLILEWPCHFEALHITPAEALSRPPCDIAVAVGSIIDKPQTVLVSLRGGPHAELALRLSLSIARTRSSQVTSLHLLPTATTAPQDAPYRGLERVLANMPEIHTEEIQTDEPAASILAYAQSSDLLVMGATALPGDTSTWIGPVVRAVLDKRHDNILIVKTRRPMPSNMESEAAGQTAISVLVDRWFAENTYHADEFNNLDYLLSLKRRQNLTISLALPALNEQETIGNIIQTVKKALMDEVPLLDEIVLVDSDSSDRTREIAQHLGIPVYIHQQTLERLGARVGKGEALWKSLYVTRGDIVIWIDTDIVNIHPSFVFGLLGPLLQRPSIQFVKGFYRRPLRVDNIIKEGGGGRVTELTARPLLNLFYPEVSGIIQPLAGEYGGRRSALERLPFFSGYGVEIGLLIDIFEKFGLSAIAQVDLNERIHHNQSLESLSKMSFAIIQAVIHKLERRYKPNFLEEVNKTMKLIRYEPGRFFLEVEEIAEQERPPMIELPEYQEARSIDQVSFDSAWGN